MAVKNYTQFDMTTNKIINLGTPTGAADAATKGYVDSVATGLDVKASVRAATTANITLSGAQTIDGVSVISGDRVLVKNQSTGANNGIYVADASTWSRAADADASAEVTSGLFTFVEEGTLYAGTGWVLSTANPITVGSTALTFVQFSTAGAIVAGAGLIYSSGTTLAVGAGTGITVNADDVAVDTTLIPRKYLANIGDGSSTTIDVTHSFGTRDCNVQVHRVASPYDVVICDIEMLDTNNVRFKFATAPATNEYRVVIHA